MKRNGHTEVTLNHCPEGSNDYRISQIRVKGRSTILHGFEDEPGSVARFRPALQN